MCKHRLSIYFKCDGIHWSSYIIKVWIMPQDSTCTYKQCCRRPHRWPSQPFKNKKNVHIKSVRWNHLDQWKYCLSLKVSEMLTCCFHWFEQKEDVSNDLYFKVVQKFTEDFRDFTLYFGYHVPRDPRMLCNIHEYLNLNSKNNVSIDFSPVFLDHAFKAY